MRILLAFACGTGTAMFYSFTLPAVIIPVLLCLLLWIVCPFIFRSYQQRWLTGVAAMLLFYSCGILVNTLQNQLSDPGHFSRVPQARAYVVKLCEEPLPRSGSFRMKTRVLQCTDSSGRTHAAVGHILLYIGRQTQVPLPQYGDVIVLPAGLVHEVMPPRNPGEFDYRRYLAFQHVHHQAYLKDAPQGTGINRGSRLMKGVYGIQHHFKRVLDIFLRSPEEVAVAQALLYGFDDDIDEATMSAYANTGTLHVLAVSGMHVGLIFFILGKLLFFMDKNRKLLQGKRLIILLALWAYSALCGLSPSILRATVMFSFVIMAQVLGRKSNIYNTLAASCLALLCYDSNILANVGFQLSYMAVTGIVFIQPMVEKWWTPPGFLLRQVWSITSVSIAAQMGTLPIGILYFHQFPNCFLFSNLLIIPLTTLIIYLTIMLLAVSWWPAGAGIAGLVIQKLILFTNWLVLQVERVPYSYVNGLQITIPQCLLLYGMMLSLVFYFMYRYAGLFKTFLALLLVFTVMSGLQTFRVRHQKKLVVYSIPGSSAIHLVHGAGSVLYLDDSLRVNRQKFRFHIQQHIWQCGIERVDTLRSPEGWLLIEAGEKNILLSGPGENITRQRTDVLILRNPVPFVLLEAIAPRHVVIGSGVKRSWAKRISGFCRERGIPFHDVLNSGAYELSL